MANAVSDPLGNVARTEPISVEPATGGGSGTQYSTRTFAWWLPWT
ncbi:hypothetical protein [Streptomyces sp. SID14478]|nr:hypothetical protein [Streptomyces sp. SID14478]